MSGILAEVVSRMAADLVENDTSGSVFNSLSQRSIRGVGNIIQASQDSTSGSLGIGGLIQFVPARGLQRFRTLELCHHVLFGQVLLASTCTTFIKCRNHVADIGICLTGYGNTSNGYFLRHAAPVATQNNGRFQSGVEILLCLTGQDIVGAQLTIAQACSSQLIGRLLDFVSSEFLAEGFIENVDLQIVQGKQAGIHVYGRRGVLGSLGMADHAHSCLIHIVQSTDILQRIVHTIGGVAHVGSLGRTGSIGGNAEHNKSSSRQFLRKGIDRTVIAAQAMRKDNARQLTFGIGISWSVQCGLHHRTPGIDGKLTDFHSAPAARNHIGKKAEQNHRNNGNHKNAFAAVICLQIKFLFHILSPFSVNLLLPEKTSGIIPIHTWYSSNRDSIENFVYYKGIPLSFWGVDVKFYIYNAFISQQRLPCVKGTGGKHLRNCAAKNISNDKSPKRAFLQPILHHRSLW